MKNLAIVVFLVFAIGYCTYNGEVNKYKNKSATTVLTPEQARKQKVESGFSAWDGSHVELTRKVKAALRDPSSYEHIETKFKDNGDHILVITNYRAKNGFGGMNVGVVIAKVSDTGQVIEIVSQK